MKANYSLHEISSCRSKEKVHIDNIDIWVRLVIRPLSYIFTWLFLKLKVSANQATAFSAVVSVVGSLFLLFGDRSSITVGLIIMNFWIVFDCIDGNISRVTKTASKKGMFFDGISGYLYITLLYLSLGVSAYHLTEYDANYLFLIFGFSTSILVILPRLINHKMSVIFNSNGSEISEKNSYGVIMIIGLNVAGAAGLANPLMIVFFFLNHLDWYVFIYFIIHLCIGLYSFFTTMKTVRKIREND